MTRPVRALGTTPKFGYLDEGEIVLTDGFGSEYRVEQSAEAQVSAAAITWPSLPWATVQSTSSTVPDTITVTVDPAKLSSGFESAVLIVIADSRAGSYPDNLQVASVNVVKGIPFYLPFVQR